MRDAFVSIVAILAFAAPHYRCSEINKDGFNFYKDYLRARTDDLSLEAPEEAERMLYFYRTPVQLYPGLVPAVDPEYRKRTGNAFKNHMLGKEMLDEVEQPKKRNSKTALAFIMETKHQPFHKNDGVIVYEKMDLPV